MKKGISLLIPTKNRPFEYLTRLVNSCIDTCSDINLIDFCFLFINGDKDNEVSGKNLSKQYPSLNIKYKYAEQMPFNKLWNYAYKTMGERQLMMLGADDFCFNTEKEHGQFNANGWDDELYKLYSSSNDKLFLSYFKDNIQAGRCPSHPIIHCNWYNTLGFFTPERYSYWFADNFLEVVASRLSDLILKSENNEKFESVSEEFLTDNLENKRRYISYKYITHYHWSIGLVEKDDLYLENESKMTDEEQAVWHCDDNYRYIDKCALKLFEFYKQSTNE